MTQIHFKGKTYVRNHHLSVPDRPIEPDAKKSVGKPRLDGNLIIHGDNLEALKALSLKYGYSGKVKCIYIDPPYNTGNEGWRYNDNVSSPQMQSWLLENPVSIEDGLRHDKWCSMMWPRLTILHDILAENGVIFVSIDDNEHHRLRLMMDEIFGDHNFIGSFVWEGTGKNNSKFISSGHDYILAYAKDIESLNVTKGKWRIAKEGLDAIYKKVTDLKSIYKDDYKKISCELDSWYNTLDKKDASWKHRHYRVVDERGVYFPGDISSPGTGNRKYEVLHPKTKKPVKVPARGWGVSNIDKMMEKINQGYVAFGDDETSVPNLKMYLHETEEQVLSSVFYQDRRAATKSLRTILGSKDFEYPKDVRVLERLFEAVTDKDDIILDSFAGSGTTAHATLALNKADGGNRKFILVECEDYADKITAERVRRVIRGVPLATDKALKAGLGGEFTYCTLGKPIHMEKILNSKELPAYKDLAATLFHIATNQAIDLAKIDAKSSYIGESSDYHVWMIYKPDSDFLLSHDAAFTLKFAKEITQSKRDKKRHLVFAALRFVSEDVLAANKDKPLLVDYQPLPWALYRIGKSK